MRGSELLAALGLMGIATAHAAQLCFPDAFLFGTATAAYQVEGGWNEGGRTPSIWDDACRQHASLACANVADDFYHRYKEDIQLMKESGVKSFRFSVSWSRVMNWDQEAKHMTPNAPGVAFYHALIAELVQNGIKPILTIFHWDLPTELEHQMTPGGWLNPKIQEHYLEFAELMFHEYGEQVEYWATFNEPWVFTAAGYGIDAKGVFPPGVTKSDTAQYTAAHNVLLSHAKAVQKFRALKAKGTIQSHARIGIVLNCDYVIPADPSNPDDVAAVDTGLEFFLGWFLQPIVSGEYPAAMRERAGKRLPEFTAEETALLKGSYDLFMLNHYSTHEVTKCDSPRSTKHCDSMTPGWERDLGADTSVIPVGARQSSKSPDGSYNCPGFSAYPRGYRDLIRWVHSHNTTADILLTENGWCGNEEIDNKDQLWYYQEYLTQVHKAITEDKIPIVGYTAWSFMDNYEWGSYKPRYGLYYVNFTDKLGAKESWDPKSTDLTRVPRTAAKWFAQVAKTNCMDAVQEETARSTAVLDGTTRSSWMTWAMVLVVIALITGTAFVVAYIRRHRWEHVDEQAPLLHE